MTYKTLKFCIEAMSEEQKNKDVTFFDNRNEFFGVSSLNFADPETCDVLDDGHPFLTSL